MNRTGRLTGLLALAAATTAGAATNYPPPSNPGATGSAPPGPHRTLFVCERGIGHGCFARLQDAVDAAKAGDTVRVPAGRWREAVTIRGVAKRYLRLIGDPEAPGRVVLEGGRKRGIGVWVRGADHVTVRGFEARRYLTAGFAVSGVDGFSLRNVVAMDTGAHGFRVTGSTGGLISDAAASEGGRFGFSIAATPAQTRPLRTVVRRATAFANRVGLGGTGLRHVTVTDSLLFGNGIGITATDAEDVVIDGNDVFWNNLAADVPFAGSAIVLTGGEGNAIMGNRVFGNHLVGVLLTGEPGRTRLADTSFGVNALTETPAEDLNGRDLAYAGGGSENCFGAHAFRSPTVPADGSTFVACPFSGPNASRDDARAEVAGWENDATRQAHWIRHPHRPIEGFEPPPGG